MAGLSEIPDEGVARAFIKSVRHQQNRAFRFRVFQDELDKGEDFLGSFARCRHDLRGDRGKQVIDYFGIIREGDDGMRRS